MRYLRNLCARHEPLVNGFPLPGQAHRISALTGIDAYLRVSLMMDRDLADWMVQDTLAKVILLDRPQAIREDRA